jgi:hypothetical protein
VKGGAKGVSKGVSFTTRPKLANRKRQQSRSTKRVASCASLSLSLSLSRERAKLGSHALGSTMSSKG